MTRLIFIPADVKREIEKAFKTTNVTLWSALTYKTNSGFAKTLRAAALEKGGVIYPAEKKGINFIPDCFTSFETSDRTMTQVFSNRVSLVIDYKKSSITQYVDGEEDCKYTDVNLEKFGDIQFTAMALAKQLN